MCSQLEIKLTEAEHMKQVQLVGRIKLELAILHPITIHSLSFETRN